MDSINITITGIAPLLMHNSRLSNPLDEYAQALKKVTGVRKKTEEHHKQMSEIEALGGLYWDEKHSYYIPGENIEACLIGAAKLKKLGTAFKRGAQVVDQSCPIVGHGAPDSPEELSKNPDYLFVKSVKVGTARVMRTRPIFEKWSTSFTVAFDESQMRREDILEAANSAGAFVGLCDWRPRFGKFIVSASQ